MSLNRLVLVINASYEPVNICPARRAFTLVLKGAAVVEKASPYTVRTGRLVLPVPSVIRLVKYRRVPRLNRSVSRKGIILRDGERCQYCLVKFPSAHLTLDHVIPKSRGGESTWTNLVAACFPCNNAKGSKTPVEAGMALAKKPAQVSLHAKHRMMQGDEEGWSQYMFV